MEHLSPCVHVCDFILSVYVLPAIITRAILLGVLCT